MRINKLKDLKEKLCTELEDMADGTITSGNLAMIDTMAHSIKNIGKIIMMEGEEYSSASGWGRDTMMHRDSYGRESYGDSYGRSRDMRGRYSRGGSRQEMVSSLETMMEDATNNSERMAIQRCIDELRK